MFRMRDPLAAGDITQDTFLHALKAIGSLRHHERFMPWLLTIAHNQIANYLRGASRRPRTVGLPEPGHTTPDGLVFEDDDGAEVRAAAARVLAAADHLTDLQRQVVALRFVSGLTVKETAAIMGRGESAVRNLQFHAVANLRRLALEGPASRVQESGPEARAGRAEARGAGASDGGAGPGASAIARRGSP